MIYVEVLTANGLVSIMLLPRLGGETDYFFWRDDQVPRIDEINLKMCEDYTG